MSASAAAAVSLPITGKAAPRPAGHRTVELPLIVGFGTLLLLLALTGWLAIGAMRATVRGIVWVDHTHEVVEILKELELDVREAESALRHYVFSGDTAQLDEYRKQAFDEVSGHVQTLRRLTAGDAEQFQRLDGVEPLVREQMLRMEALRQAYATDPASVREKILTLNVARTHDPLVQALEQFGEHENQFLERRVAAREAEARRTTVAVVCSGVLGLLCVAASLFFILGGLKRRRQIEAQLQGSLAEREILLKEVHHRVKNNLQVVSSLLSLEAEKLTEAQGRAVFAECRDRIHSMARLHQQLYARGQFAFVDFASHLRETATMLVEAHQPAGCEVALEIETGEVTLDLDSAVTLGLIANEILLNSLKHAFRGRHQGTLTVGLQSGELIVRDDGVGLPPHFDPKRHAGLGLELILGLTQQLRGRAQIVNGPEGGTVVTVAFPQQTPASL